LPDERILLRGGQGGGRDGGFEVLAKRGDSVHPEAALLDRPALRPAAVDRMAEVAARSSIDSARDLVKTA
jgi:hypothetical protein